MDDKYVKAKLSNKLKQQQHLLATQVYMTNFHF